MLFLKNEFKKIFYKKKTISYLIFSLFCLKNLFINFFNKFFAKYIDLGSGKYMEEIYWLNFDYQINKWKANANLPTFKNIKLIYSSHFFEHIDDNDAMKMFVFAYNTLQKNGILRISVPNPKYFVDLYKQGKKKVLQQHIGKVNLDTWKVYNVNTESLEQLLICCIMMITNSNYILTKYKHEEKVNGNPPTFLIPNVNGGINQKLKNYYCGPPINISDKIIRENVLKLDIKNFVYFVYSLSFYPETKNIIKGVFNFWHKNFWDYNKIKYYAKECGFQSIEMSEFLAPGFEFLKKKNRESIGHKPYSIYVNCIK